MKHAPIDNNCGVIPCNGQPEKHLGNSNMAKELGTANKPENKSGADSIDVNVVTADQGD